MKFKCWHKEKKVWMNVRAIYFWCGKDSDPISNWVKSVDAYEDWELGVAKEYPIEEVVLVEDSTGRKTFF